MGRVPMLLTAAVEWDVSTADPVGAFTWPCAYRFLCETQLNGNT